MMVETLKRIRRQAVRAFVENNAEPFTLSVGKTLIVAPHPDDETFACGGLIALKKDLGSNVKVLFLSRGEGAHRACCATSEHTIGEVRQRLAAEACAHLGLKPSDLLWCDYPDGAIPGKKDPAFVEVATKLSGILSDVALGEIFTPHPHDCWPDHQRATELVLAAAAMSKCAAHIYCYPVWMWHNLRLRDLGQLKGWQVLRLDIRLVQEKKLTAMRQYLEETNPACGISYCGNLPSGFLNPFQRDFEIFFRASKGNRS